MKLLFVTRVFPDEHGFQGGVFILNQARALIRAGHEAAVLLLDFRSPRRKRRWGFSRYRLDGVEVYRWAFPCGPVFPLIEAAAPILSRRLYEKAAASFGAPALLYAHFGDAAIDAAALKRRFGVPVVVLEHDSGVLTGSYAESALRARRKAYESADAVLAVSAALAEKVQALTRHPVGVVPNIVPGYMFEGARTGQDAAFTFIGVGNMLPSKAFDETLRAFAALGEADARLLLVGDGPELPRLRALAEELGVAERTGFPGRVDNRALAALLRRCACFVLPSRFETFGVAYLEAMAAGLPVIATRCGGPEEFVNGDNGMLVPVGDREALTGAMRRMLARRADYDPAAISAFARAFCSEEAVVGKLERVFRQAADKPTSEESKCGTR